MFSDKIKTHHYLIKNTIYNSIRKSKKKINKINKSTSH